MFEGEGEGEGWGFGGFHIDVMTGGVKDGDNGDGAVGIVVFCLGCWAFC